MNSRARNSGANVDELDGLLSAFFKAAMPKPWPALRLPSVRAVRSRRWVPQVRSRFALAASVALLVGGALYLGGMFRASEKPRGPGIMWDSAKSIKTELILEQSPDGPTTI